MNLKDFFGGMSLSKISDKGGVYQPAHMGRLIRGESRPNLPLVVVLHRFGVTPEQFYQTATGVPLPALNVSASALPHESLTETDLKLMVAPEKESAVPRLLNIVLGGGFYHETLSSLKSPSPPHRLLVNIPDLPPRESDGLFYVSLTASGAPMTMADAGQYIKTARQKLGVPNSVVEAEGWSVEAVEQGHLQNRMPIEHLIRLEEHVPGAFPAIWRGTCFEYEDEVFGFAPVYRAFRHLSAKDPAQAQMWLDDLRDER